MEWTLHRQPAAIQDMRVNHGGFHIPDIIALLQQMHGKTVSEGLYTEALVEPHCTPCLTHSLWSSTRARMMTPGDPGA
jgi:hypothetical protein